MGKHRRKWGVREQCFTERDRAAANTAEKSRKMSTEDSLQLSWRSGPGRSLRGAEARGWEGQRKRGGLSQAGPDSVTFSEAVWRQDGEVKGNGENPLSCHSQGREGGWGDHPVWAGPLLTLEQQSPHHHPDCSTNSLLHTEGGSRVYEQLDQPAHLSACPPLPPLPTLPLTVATSQPGEEGLKKQPAQAL